MLSSLSRLTGKDRQHGERSPFSSPYSARLSTPVAARRSSLEERRRPAAYFDRELSPGPASPIEEEDKDANEDANEDANDEEVDEEEEEEEDGGGESSPLLPIFSAAHLDALPVYNLTHTIRLLIVPRCETTLSWDQLRSPQVSQFLVKPIQQQIRTSHFSSATIYALLANCLQFKKEEQLYPGNSGTSRTRALVAELLAMRLLREFSTRELLDSTKASPDALSYDFYPLQGLLSTGSGTATPGPNWDASPIFRQQQPRVARISALEVAIRALSKRFLAHPLVVQQLEAIWAGSIVFHSAADNLHRPPSKVIPNQNRGYGAMGSRGPVLQASPERLQPAKQRDHLNPVAVTVRRSATLYDPRDASLFKLSRLRVPRYRQFLSTCSFAILLGLYLAVLIERSLTITLLEVIFWFWSAGFMLDEVVGFNEQGFSLYIMSFWNAFDLGILLLLMCYYGMRLYGILMPDVRKHQTADMAYDLLAANAVLLFPRLFSVLDHSRYFSQLLIAFRMMAMDLLALFILIAISCSGFFVAFTLSFGGDDFNGRAVVYTLFQLLMGFTPAAWDTWENYNILGKMILTLFLFICHFLVVTILITVLTNSFMAVVQNANEEHQFVFAVNAISMVKSDALFSYIAPTNVLAWLLAPLRFVLPFRKFVRINRTAIKVTHFPILFLIYAYEKLVLRRQTFDSTDLVMQRGRTRNMEAPATGLQLFSPNHGRLREPSVATFHKDRALAEVFRRPFRDNTIRNTQKSHERRKTSNVVNHWMSGLGPDGTASPPMEQDPKVVNKLEARRVAHRRSQLLQRRARAGRGPSHTAASMSVVSGPAENTATGAFDSPGFHQLDSDFPSMSMDGLPQQTDADGDDELVTNDEDDHITLERQRTPMERTKSTDTEKETEEEYFQATPTAPVRKFQPLAPLQNQAVKTAAPLRPAGPNRAQTRPNRAHVRHTSTNTIIHDPTLLSTESSSSPSRKATTARNSARNAGSGSGAMTPASAGRRTPKRQLTIAARPRPIMPPRTAFQSTPNLAGMVGLDSARKRPSSFALELGSDIGDNKAVGGGFVGAMPASFATQMAYASGAMRAGETFRGNDEQQRMSKLMLARFNQLEEGFREVIKEVKDWRKEDIRSADERPVSRRAKTKSTRPGRGGGKVRGEAEIAEDRWMDENDIPQDGRGRACQLRLRAAIMTKQNGEPTAAEKGKGKMVDNEAPDGKKQEDGNKDKDGKPIINGKKGDEPEEEELSEEDQQLKSELEMLVSRLKEPDSTLYIPALDAIKDFIKTSTSSMTAVPKPLKFLMPHYADLTAIYEEWPTGNEKSSLADVLSVLGMTQGDEEKLETLKYRLLAPSKDLGSWGHEYIRHLALEIGQDYNRRTMDDEDSQELLDLARTLVPHFLSHNAEADAVDLLSELERIQEVPQYLDENTYSRVCLYMVSMVNLLTYPEDQQFLRTAHDIYMQYDRLPQAIVLAIRMNDTELIHKDFDSTKDVALKKQLALLVARQQIWLEAPSESEEDQELVECLSNEKLPNHFKFLAKELNILDPKMPEDIYKSHLESSRTAGLTNVDSARHNLASAFVNAFTNAGFGNDKMMLVEGDKTSWVFKTKDDGMISTTASMGMLLKWDIEGGLDQIDKYTYAPEDQIKAGALLAIGILNSGVRLDSEPALALLSDEDNIMSKNVGKRVASIMGLGLACAGTNKEELLELLLPIVEDTTLEMHISAMAALSLGLIFVGSGNDRVSETIITTLLDEDRQRQLKDKWTRFMSLGLALLFFGRQEEVEVVLETLKAIDHPMAKPASVLAEVCAWAGTGTVLKLQELLHICNDHIEDNEEKKGDELLQTYAVIGLSLIAMGEDVGQEMVLRQFGHLMHYGEANIRKAVPLAMGLISPSNPQMKVYDTLSRYSHDNDNEVAINAIFAMGMLGAGTNNARLAQLLRQLASYYHRDQNSLFMVRIAQGLLHMGKGTMSINPFHTDRQVLSRVATAGLLAVLVAMIDAKQFILSDSHYLLYFIVCAMHPRFLVTLDEELKPLQVNVRVGQAVDVVGQAGRPKTITGWQTQNTPVLLAYGERAELEDEQYISLASNLEGLVILRKNPAWNAAS
ncbi:MAG: hypothetical protein Q9226_001784 [Calogaya cf. arnoldii]